MKRVRLFWKHDDAFKLHHSSNLFRSKKTWIRRTASTQHHDFITTHHAWRAWLGAMCGKFRQSCTAKKWGSQFQTFSYLMSCNLSFSSQGKNRHELFLKSCSVQKFSRQQDVAFFFSWSKMCFQKACFPFHPHFEKVETNSCCFCDTKISFNSVVNSKQESPVVTIRKLCTLEMLSSLCSRMVAVPVSSREHGAQNSRGRFGSQTAVNIVRKKKQDQRKTSLGSLGWKEVALISQNEEPVKPLGWR